MAVQATCFAGASTYARREPEKGEKTGRKRREAEPHSPGIASPIWPEEWSQLKEALFLRKAIRSQRMPTKITLDAYAASHRAVADLQETGELSKRVRVRSNKYLNNLIEQDHRRVKQRLRPILGLKNFRTAAVVISGIELIEKIRKGPYKVGKLGGRMATTAAIWQAALSS